MRPIADIPVQKLLGVCADFWGCFSLAYALLVFENSCYFNLRQAVLVPDIDAGFYVGPGLYCYAICCVSAFIRMTVHWLTPLPGQSGCGAGADQQLMGSHSSICAGNTDIEMVPTMSPINAGSASETPGQYLR